MSLWDAFHRGDIGCGGLWFGDLGHLWGSARLHRAPTGPSMGTGWVESGRTVQAERTADFRPRSLQSCHSAFS
jgi:hypothetical protein